MSSKIGQIQGIRALAIFSVFVTHTSIWLGDDLGWFAPIAAQLGSAGVVAFFLLSGFLLSYKQNVVPELNGKQIIMTAWGKVSKMYGLYLLTMFVTFLAKCPSTPKGWIQALICLPFHLSITQAFVPISWVTHAFNGPAWFLSALFGIWILIYLCRDYINKILGASSKKSLAVICCLLGFQLIWLLFANKVIHPFLSREHCLLWFYDWLIYSSPILCFSEHVIGIALGQICLRNKLSIRMQNLLAVVATCMVLTFMGKVAVHAKIVVPWIVIVECIVCVGIIAVISPQSIGCKILSWRPLVWFGDISGYFFLIHGAVNYVMLSTIADYIPKPWLFFVALSISILLSACAGQYYNRKSSSIITNNEKSKRFNNQRS